MQKWFYCFPFCSLQLSQTAAGKSYLNKLLQDQRNLIAWVRGKYFPTHGVIADGCVGGCEFLNMHNTISTLQNSAGGRGKIAFITLKMLHFVGGSKAKVKNHWDVMIKLNLSIRWSFANTTWLKTWCIYGTQVTFLHSIKAFLKIEQVKKKFRKSFSFSLKGNLTPKLCKTFHLQFERLKLEAP